MWVMGDVLPSQGDARFPLTYQLTQSPMFKPSNKRPLSHSLLEGFKRWLLRWGTSGSDAPPILAVLGIVSIVTNRIRPSSPPQSSWNLPLISCRYRPERRIVSRATGESCRQRL